LGYDVEWVDFVRTVKIKARHKSWVGEIVEIKGKGVVVVATDKTRGSGYISSGSRYGELDVETCYHVVEDASKIRVKAYNGKWYRAEVKYVRPDKDLARLTVDGWESEIGNLLSECYWWGRGEEQVQVGEEIVVIGHPLGLEGSVSTGITSAKRYLPRYPGDEWPVPVYQITAPVSPGSSGAPVFDREGAWVGHVVGTFEEGQLINIVVGRW